MNRLMPYLQLVRLPTVFTAVADILLGFALTTGVFISTAPSPDGPIDLDAAMLEDGESLGMEAANELAEPKSEWVWQLGWLIAASSCLYLSGMVFNDVFDRRADAEDRPEAPIPSGKVSVKTAATIGVLLMASGLVASYLAGINKSNGQLNPLRVAGMLCVAILLYDSVLKRTLLAPLMMGGCRFLNIILGASTLNFFVGDGILNFFKAVFSRPQLGVGIGLGVFVMGVTWFARTETRESNRWQLGIATLFVNAGIATLIFFIRTWPGQVEWTSVAFVLAFVALIIDRRLIAAISDPSPDKVQTAVKTMLMSLVVLDATMIYWKTENVTLSCLTVGLLVPSIVLSRWIRVT